MHWPIRSGRQRRRSGGSEAIGAGFISNVSPYWARLSARDELEAYDLGDHDASQVLNVGWGYYTLWIVGGGVGQPPSLALDFFHQAALLDPTNPVDLLDQGIADLAMGDYQAGAQSFAVGVRHMLYDCPAGARTADCTTPQPSTSYGLPAGLVRRRHGGSRGPGPVQGGHRLYGLEGGHHQRQRSSGHLDGQWEGRAWPLRQIVCSTGPGRLSRPQLP